MIKITEEFSGYVEYVKPMKSGKGWIVKFKNAQQIFSVFSEQIKEILKSDQHFMIEYRKSGQFFNVTKAKETDAMTGEELAQNSKDIEKERPKMHEIPLTGESQFRTRDEIVNSIALECAIELIKEDGIWKDLEQPNIVKTTREYAKELAKFIRTGE